MAEELTKDEQTVTPDDTGPGPVSLLCDREWQGFLDKDDRNSPEEYPEMILINRAEFGALICEGYLLAKDQDRAALSAREAELAEVRGALGRWECTACDGRGGSYFDNENHVCHVCSGSRLNPIARAALSPKGGE